MKPKEVRDPRSAYADSRRGTGRGTLVPASTLASFCRRNHIGRLSLYGSVLRTDFRPDSDVDVLVEFEQGHTPGLLKLADLEAELSAMFGRKVDLRTPGDLSPYIRARVLREAEVQYASAR